MLEELMERLMSPDKFSIFLFTLGFSLIVSVTGVVRGLKFLGLSAPVPRSTKEKRVIGMVGIVLVLLGAAKSLSLAVYAPAISAKQIYSGNDAKQIVADGEDVYLLKRNGNVFRISRNRLEPVDLSEDNVRISPAGGTLYILKNNGNILSYVSVSGRVPAEEDPIQLKDDGTRTQQILAAGADLYIRKESGNIWKYFARPVERDMNKVRDEYVLVDDGTNTRQIATSGSILYILKESGAIWQYVPTHEKLFGKIYQADNEDQKANFIAASGGTLYFIRNDGSTWKYKKNLSIIEKSEIAKEIDAVGCILYIRTIEGEIIRYNTNDDDLRRIGDAGNDNHGIAAFGQDIFVIKNDGSVWRYSEYIRKR